MTLASRPASRSSIDEGGLVRPGGRRGTTATSSRACSSGVGDDDALAGGEAVGLEHGARPVRGQLPDERARPRRSSPPAKARARAMRTPGRLGDLVAERLGRLHPGRGLARAEDRDPGRVQRVGHAGAPAAPPARRRRGPLPSPARARRPRRGPAGPPAAQRTPGSGGDPRAPGRDDHLVDAGLAGQLPGERVLATAAAEDEDAGGHGGASRGVRRLRPASCGRWRIGRQARSMVWVRSGPTETNTIGTPACSSSAVT